MGLVTKTRRLVQADGRFEAAVGLQEQACAGNRVVALNRGQHQRPAQALPLKPFCDGHFGQLKAALALMLQGNGTNDLAIHQGKQDMTTVVYHLALRIGQYDAIDLFDAEEALQPLSIKAIKRAGVLRFEVDDLHRAAKVAQRDASQALNSSEASNAANDLSRCSSAEPSVWP